MEDPYIDQWTEAFTTIYGMGLLAVVLIFFFITIGSWLFTTVAFMFGAKVAKIDDRSFGKALLAVVLIFFIGSILTSILTLINPWLSLVGLILPLLFIQWVYSCSFGKAFFAYITSMIASFIFNGFFVFAIVLGFSAFFKVIPRPEESNKTEEVQVEDSSGEDPFLDDTTDKKEKNNTKEKNESEI